MRSYPMSQFLSLAHLKKAMAEDCVKDIRSIVNLLYNTKGDDISPEEQLEMIESVVAQYKGIKK